jgi:hypothetical protein
VGLLGASAGVTVSKAAAPPPIGKTRMRMHLLSFSPGPKLPTGSETRGRDCLAHFEPAAAVLIRQCGFTCLYGRYAMNRPP